MLAQWRQDGFLTELGADHIHPDKRSAIHAICQRLEPTVCSSCRVRVFEECHDPAIVAQPDAQLTTASQARSGLPYR